MEMTKRLRARWPVRLVVLASLALAGCSTSASNSGLNLVDASGNHPAGFVSTHPSLVLSAADTAQCQPCHGDDLRGGISNVSCFSASRNGVACHAGGPVFHPESWLDCTSVLTSRAAWHATAYQDNFLLNGKRCDECHVLAEKCTLCHFDVGGRKIPVGSTYTHGTVGGHSAFDADSAARAVCIACHDTHNRFGHPPVCHNCHEPFPGGSVPPGTHETGWLDSDATAAFHGAFVASITCGSCHPLSGHPTCTTCHFDANGSRAYAPLSFAHDAEVFSNHRSGALRDAAGNVCENCHRTSRTYRGGVPSCADGGATHPDNDGCHYDASLLDPVFANPRY